MAIDIFITTYLRPEFSKKCVEYLKARTKTEHRITVIDNGGNEHLKDMVDRYIPLWTNTGIHFPWNIAVSLAEGPYFVTTDPDILCPDLEDYAESDVLDSTGQIVYRNLVRVGGGTYSQDWLAKMIKLMDERPNYGAISAMPHVFIGAAGIDPQDPDDVKERNMCGAVLRVMRTDMVKVAGGWDLRIEAGRNHEESTICSRLQSHGWKVGICSRIRAYHMFGTNWGYPESFTPEMQKHRPELKDYVKSFDNIDAYDPDTFLPK